MEIEVDTKEGDIRIEMNRRKTLYENVACNYFGRKLFFNRFKPMVLTAYFKIFYMYYWYFVSLTIQMASRCRGDFFICFVFLRLLFSLVFSFIFNKFVYFMPFDICHCCEWKLAVLFITGLFLIDG